MTPAINVNLQRCACPSEPDPSLRHASGHCPAEPILIPCPIPRSVTFAVALGECECVYPALAKPPVDPHRKTCPARPVRVSCSISGKTWEESGVGDIERADEPHGLFVDGLEYARTSASCRDRWALVKGLVLSQRAFLTSDATKALEAQRDTIFAALADMARAEQGHFNASTTLFSALKTCDVERAHVTGPASYAMGWDDPSDADAALNSRAGLAAYVEMLIEQVGVL